MSLSNEIVKQKLVAKFGEQVSNFAEPYGMLTFEAPKELNLKVLNFLYDDEELNVLSKELKVQECDATKDDSSNEVGKII